MKVVRSLCSALTLVFLVTLAAGPVTAQPLEDVVRSAILAVAAVSPEGRACGAATAFHVGGGKFLTSAHVVDELRKGARAGCRLWFVMQARDTRLPEYPIAIVRAACVDPRYRETPDRTVAPYDVAILEVQELGVGERLPPTLALSARMPRPGETVRVVGFPTSTEPVRFDIRGVVTEVSRTVFIVDNRTAGAIPGVSGSPVLDATGHVIGVVFGVNVGSRRAAAVPIATALERCRP
jgi:V8-like Glu-specific endopeptidase